MRIIGIDPGTATTGFSILEIENRKLKLIDYGVIKTKPKQDEALRLQQIAEDLKTLIKNYNPSFASVEEIFFKNNAKTVISVAQARGVVLQNLYNQGIEIHGFTPLQVKSSICGYGKADKKMVQEMVKKIMKLDHIPKPDDAADAIALAICLANTLKLQRFLTSNQ
jgi:crossover junction endodeoxyribonuclease RuvC